MEYSQVKAKEQPVCNEKEYSKDHDVDDDGNRIEAIPMCIISVQFHRPVKNTLREQREREKQEYDPFCNQRIRLICGRINLVCGRRMACYQCRPFQLALPDEPRRCSPAKLIQNCQSNQSGGGKYPEAHIGHRVPNPNIVA